MALWLYQFSATLAQVASLDEGDRAAAPAPAPRPMSFSDLQQGLRSYNNGDTNSNYFRYGLIAMVVIVVLIAILLHLRQRRKEGGPPDSTRQLAWELSRKIHFPLVTRLILAWVSKTTDVPMATLLISASAFDRAVSMWSQKPTFALVRRWGGQRLVVLKPRLFE